MAKTEKGFSSHSTSTEEKTILLWNVRKCFQEKWHMNSVINKNFNVDIINSSNIMYKKNKLVMKHRPLSPCAFFFYIILLITMGTQLGSIFKSFCRWKNQSRITLSNKVNWSTCVAKSKVWSLSTTLCCQDLTRRTEKGQKILWEGKRNQ